MGLALRSLHDAPSLNGTIDRRYPLGDAPVVQSSSLGINLAAFNAANFVLTNFNAGGIAVDFNYRQFLTGTSAATAVLSVSAASGFLGNWVIDASGNGISNNLSIAGSGQLFVSASNGVDPPVSFPAQSWSILSQSQQGAIKLVVGNGFWTDNQYWGNATTVGQEQTNFNNYFPIWSANPLVKYFYLSLTWGACEGPTRGDYSLAFAAIDAVLAKLATAGHKMGLIVEIWQTFFNTTSITDTRQWPQYVINNGWIQACTEAGANRTQLKWDIDDLWAAYGDTCAAICTRYNNHPLFFGFSPMDESEAISVVDNVTQPPGSGLSPGQTIINSAHYCTQFLALQKRLLSILTNTPLYVPFNYLPPGDSTTPTTMANMINSLEAQSPKHCIYGGPDPFWRQTTFQKLVAGLYPAVMGDIRKNILLMNRVQEGFLGNRGNPPTDPGVTPGQLYDNAVQNNCVMLTWNHENWEFYKYADEIAAISARNGVVGTPPSGGNYTII